MKPPVRPDVPAESIQPAQPVQANQQDHKAKPVQPAHPIQPVKPIHQSVQPAHQPVRPVHQPSQQVQPKQPADSFTQSEKYPQSKVINLSPYHSVPTITPHVENGTARPQSPVREYMVYNIHTCNMSEIPAV